MNSGFSNSFHKALKFAMRKSFVRMGTNRDEFLVFSTHDFTIVLHEHKGYTRSLMWKVSKRCTCMYYSAYLHKSLLHTCPPCYQLLAGNQILCQLPGPVHLTSKASNETTVKVCRHSNVSSKQSKYSSSSMFSISALIHVASNDETFNARRSANFQSEYGILTGRTRIRLRTILLSVLLKNNF